MWRFLFAAIQGFGDVLACTFHHRRTNMQLHSSSRPVSIAASSSHQVRPTTAYHFVPNQLHVTNCYEGNGRPEPAAPKACTTAQKGKLPAQICTERHAATRVTEGRSPPHPRPAQPPRRECCRRSRARMLPLSTSPYRTASIHTATRVTEADGRRTQDLHNAQRVSCRRSHARNANHPNHCFVH